MAFDLKNLPRFIDHTLLKADAAEQAIQKLCEEAKQFGFYSVCVNSQWVPLCSRILQDTQVKISVVCGFPLGANRSAVKAFEAADAVDHGAHEIDMVLPVGLLLEGNYAAVEVDIRQVTAAVEGKAIVKVIMETGYLNDDQKRMACLISEQAGAHYVKTSTGFGPGAATVEDILLMRASVSSAIGVKASGGVRDLQAALQMIEAGATGLGTSSGVAIMNGAAGSTAY